ncbi:T9SS type A sorting domain-containing protein [Flammeovirga pectinis]|uniref:T9SS type A sorting domain-containing protein n=1 Tax=Flammeovirga pectinis TaxID=2494373 RepID=A0A3Q9FUI7_9BACT|nr:right-handed parallel beta-helix repeat-containing protein [Flammeovirga pectinis]AZQ64885.1 T9SS type A sorting domain-containing protein [Flammeovirga pectinis]
MKKIITVALLWFLTFLPGFASNYYVDAINGNDTNNGTSESSAWKSMNKVNTLTLNGGDAVYFKAGVEIYGTLKPKGSGTSENPIIIGKYGGEAHAKINGEGYTSVITLSNVQGYIVKDLELVNDQGTALEDNALTERVGVTLSNSTDGIKYFFKFSNLKMHDIYPNNPTDDEANDPAYKGYGFKITTYGNKETYIDGVTIENCEIYDIGYRGIIGGRWSTVAPEYAMNKNIVIRNNHIHNIGGAGIVPMHMENLLVEDNIVDHPGDTSDPRMIGRGSGIWPLRCKNVLIQRNQFLSARGKQDSCGAHIDIGNEDITIQYNYSYDNEGGFVEVLGGNKNSIYRYNISVNDGWRTGNHLGVIFWIGGYMGNNLDPEGSVNTQVYNNTIYVGEGITTYVLLQYGTENMFKNNIVHIHKNANLIYRNYSYENNFEKVDVDFDHNIFYKEDANGNPTTAPIDKDAKSVIAMPYGDNDAFIDPLIKIPGSTAADDYKLDYFSPAKSAGEIIKNAGVYDYWQSLLPKDINPTIGGQELVEVERTESKTYYLDDNNGNDNNDGLSISTPFKSVDRVNALTLLAGDSILFKGGTTFDGQLIISAKGTEENPIIIDTYGTESATLEVSNFLSVLKLDGATNIQVSNLSFKNKTSPVSEQYGIEIMNSDNIKISSCSLLAIETVDGAIVIDGATNIIVEKSEIVGTKEGYAFLLKNENRNITLQYNYLLENKSGVVKASGVLSALNFRYNLSINNEGYFVWMDELTSVENISMYNNTVYTKENITSRFQIGEGVQVMFKNNIIQTEGTFIANSKEEQNDFNHNNYFGAIVGFPTGDNDLIINPLLINPGSVFDNDYILAANSPLIGKGIAINNAGTEDYFGNIITITGNWNIGANQVASEEEIITNVVSDLDDINIVVYPNPTTNFIYLKNVPNEEVVQLITLLGKTLQREVKHQSFSLEGLVDGVYILKIGNHVTRIIKY